MLLGEWGAEVVAGAFGHSSMEFCFRPAVPSSVLTKGACEILILP